MLALFSLSSIFSVLALYRFFVDPLNSFSASLSVFLIQVLPLLILVTGLIRLRSRQILVLALVSCLYFTHGILQLISSTSRLFGIAEITFAILLCVSSTYLVRRLKLN